MASGVKQLDARMRCRFAFPRTIRRLPRARQSRTLLTDPNTHATITNTLDQTTTVGYDAAGEKTSVTDPLGHTTTYAYTLLGQLALVTDPLGDKLAYGYDAYGDQIAITQGGPSNPSMTASMVYNAVHEEVNYIDYMQNTYTYTYDADGNHISVTDPNKNTTTNTYNSLNQLISAEDPLGNVTSYGYDADGNRTTVTDPLGRTTTKVYDAQGRVLTVTDPMSGTVTYTYDLAGNQTSLTDPDGNTTTYTYDAVNRLSSTINPMGYTATYDYNAAGELTTMTDADGRTVTYSYDAVGRKIGETWVNGGYTATWTYDAAGRLTNAQDTFSSYQYGYDAANRLTSVNNSGTPGVPQVTLTYSYDNYNDRTGLTDSLGYQVSYTFNNDKLVTGIKMTTSGVSQTLEAQVTFGYDAASRLTEITRAPGDSIVTTLSYDNADRLTNMATADTLKHLSLANYTYGYDQASQLTSYLDNNNSSLTYSYDNNGELTGASGTLNGSSYAVTYSYDANGNRTMTGYTTGKGNELTSDGTYDYTYDNNGNLLTQKNISTGAVTTYTWDYRNRLTEVQAGSSTETFTYDMNNNRIGGSQNGTQQLYTVYDGKNPYIDFNGSGTLTQRYLYNPKALSQFYGQVNANGTAQWLLTDNINSIRQVVITSGSVLATITYDPYGNIVGTLNSSAPRFLYTGGAYDSITGNYQDDARYYGPADGRFESQDPLSFQAGDANLYRYVFNDPTMLRDPRGEFCFKCGLAAAGGGALTGAAGGAVFGGPVGAIVVGGVVGIGSFIVGGMYFDRPEDGLAAGVAIGSGTSLALILATLAYNAYSAIRSVPQTGPTGSVPNGAGGQALTPEQIMGSARAERLVSLRQTLAALREAHQAGIDQEAPAQLLFENAQRIHALEAEIAELEAQLQSLLPDIFP